MSGIARFQRENGKQNRRLKQKILAAWIYDTVHEPVSVLLPPPEDLTSCQEVGGDKSAARGGTTVAFTG